MKPQQASHRRPAEEPSPTAPRRYVVPVCAALALLTLAVYAQTAGHGFISYDDDQYVYENPRVQAGLTAANIAWAFTTFFYANWHPLTWLSHMLDWQLFGQDAGYHHLVNVGLHIGSTILLLLVLWRTTQRLWPSAMVAAIFALHPMHVESVAWVAERKDVLSGFLGMLALWLYARYVEAPALRRYLAVALVFALGLMAKPMLVTLPLVLLLLDYWPLGRLPWPVRWPALRPLLWEKAPLLALAGIDSVLTFLAQRSFGSVVALGRLPVSARVANSATAYVSYLAKAVWPVDLAVLYPAHGQPAGTSFLAILLLLAITAGALWTARQRPYLLTGWLWYTGMLVPVIGLVQVGAQSMADRYSYFPYVGLSIAVVWGVAELVHNRPVLRHTAAAAAVLAVILMAAMTYRQTAYWMDSETLFEHTLAVTEANSIMHNNLGVVLSRDNRHEGALTHFQQALAIDPAYSSAHANLGHEWLRGGQYEKAVAELNEALRLKPDIAVAHADLGILFAAAGHLEEGSAQLAEALRLSPANAETHNNYCYVLQHLRRMEEAMAQCRESLRLKPDLVDAHYNLGTAFAAQGRKAEALAEFSQVLAANPSHAASRRAIADLGK